MTGLRRFIPSNWFVRFKGADTAQWTWMSASIHTIVVSETVENLLEMKFNREPRRTAIKLNCKKYATIRFRMISDQNSHNAIGINCFSFWWLHNWEENHKNIYNELICHQNKEQFITKIIIIKCALYIIEYINVIYLWCRGVYSTWTCSCFAYQRQTELLINNGFWENNYSKLHREYKYNK